MAEKRKTDDKFAKCPFFKSRTSNTIECESDFAFSCVNKFQSGEEAARYRSIYCNTFNYKNCSLCKNILKTYTRTGEKQARN